MSGTRKDLTTDLAPADEPLAAEYERDFYSWLMEQARHLRDGRDRLSRGTGNEGEQQPGQPGGGE